MLNWSYYTRKISHRSFQQAPYEVERWNDLHWRWIGFISIGYGFDPIRCLDSSDGLERTKQHVLPLAPHPTLICPLNRNHDTLKSNLTNPIKDPRC